ncbi:hypothetical protein SAMN05421869_13914 [Nonomuraea jiangxiensis]|uniref:Uncharacterized protein n=1 Tax=Nonomuraea jiangxiensis TaxID=633440 RepID=A0A1G9RQ26_9ACTN|nr:hypothetical protein SAMN05421869_13914 [Nonomuraea jiangxiensis]
MVLRVAARGRCRPSSRSARRWRLLPGSPERQVLRRSAGNPTADSRGLDESPRPGWRRGWEPPLAAALEGPAPPYEIGVPAQQRARCHEQPLTTGWRQQSRQCADHRPIRPRRPGPCHLPAQHRELMTQDENFRVLRLLRATQQHQPTRELDEDQVEQPQRHEQRSCPPDRESRIPGQPPRPSFGHPQPGPRSEPRRVAPERPDQWLREPARCSRQSAALLPQSPARVAEAFPVAGPSARPRRAVGPLVGHRSDGLGPRLGPRVAPSAFGDRSPKGPDLRPGPFVSRTGRAGSVFTRRCRRP